MSCDFSCCRLIIYYCPIYILSKSVHTLLYHNISPPQGFSSGETPWYLSLSHPISTLASSSCHLFPWCYCHNNWYFLLLDLYLSHFFFPIFFTISITETIYPSPNVFFYLSIFILVLPSELFPNFS